VCLYLSLALSFLLFIYQSITAPFYALAFSYLYLVAFGAVLYGTYRMRLRARTYFSEEFEVHTHTHMCVCICIYVYICMCVCVNHLHCNETILQQWSQAEIEEFMQQFQEAHAFGLTPSVGLGMGLTPQQLDGIRERVVTGMEVMANGDDADLTCSICLVDLEVGDSYRDIQCEHIFHSACLDQVCVCVCVSVCLCTRERESVYVCAHAVAGNQSKLRKMQSARACRRRCPRG
jgi:hypothetical protein